MTHELTYRLTESLTEPWMSGACSTHDRKGREGKGIGSAEVTSVFRPSQITSHSFVAVCREPHRASDHGPLVAPSMNEAAK